MSRITDARENAAAGVWWGSRENDNTGDLVRLGYLENVLQFRDSDTVIYKKASLGYESVNLYLLGDSYTMDIPDSAYYGLKSFHYGRRDYTNIEYKLDAAQLNILLVEISERFFRRYFLDTGAIYYQVKRQDTKIISYFKPQFIPQTNFASFNPSFTVDSFFNSNINQNIEYNLFSYHFLSKIRNLKAELNAKTFHRGSGNVVISDDGKNLFIKESVSASGLESSYDTLSVIAENHYVDVLNKVYRHYKREGFDEVYISIIPNPASLIQPNFYNKLIPRIQNLSSPNPLVMPYINTYDAFSASPKEYYLKGDTHWAAKGRLLWLEKVNELLRYWDSTYHNRKTHTDETILHTRNKQNF